MALNMVMRRASSSLASLTFRAARSPFSFRSSAFSTQRLILSNQISRGSVVSSFSTFSRYSTETAASKFTVDENLVNVLKSEIECAITGEGITDEIEEKPEGFPFEIIDTPGERTVLLQRKFDGETIQVEIDTTAPYDEEEDEEEEEVEQNDEEEDENTLNIRIPMVVSVSKGDGVCLEFGVTALADEIVIESLSIKHPEENENGLAYEGPDFEDLDENLQKAFYKFLEIRGIKPTFSDYLAEYAANKDSKEYVQWLKDLKSFVEK